jgi:hypothetical protein
MIPATVLKKALAKQTYLQLREKVNGGGVVPPEAKTASEKSKVADRLIKHAFK